MAYEKKISRAEPGLIVLILDDSVSMAECMPGTSDANYAWVERYGGIIFKELLSRSTEVRGEGTVIKTRYYIYTVVYGSSRQIWGDGCMDIEAVVKKYTESGNSLGLGGNLGGTDAAAAFEVALEMLRQAVEEPRFRNSFPPMVFHLTDGESQTDAQTAADEIRRLQTGDGNVLLVNAYIGTRTNLNYNGPENFPGYLNTGEAGPSEDNIRLFNMSSEIPDSIRQNLIGDGIFPNLRTGARLFFDVRTKEMLKHVIQVVGSIGSRANRLER